MRSILALILLGASFSFALGLTLPLMRFEKLYLFEETASLLQIIASLWRDEEELLAVVVGLFSVVLPAVKLVFVHIAAVGGVSRSLGLLSAVGKWSMMDVMLVALVVFAAKTSGLAAAVTQPGLWFYGAATIATAVVANMLRR